MRRKRFLLLAVVLLLSGALGLLACGDDGGGDGDVDGDGEGDGGVSATCEPTPERCDALGDARPGRLSEHTAVYDPERLEMVVFGGTATIPTMCDFPAPEFSDETWIYDDVCNAWSEVDGPAPSATGRHMATWGDGKVWLFGGRFREPDATGDYTLYADLFRFDVAERSWRIIDVEGEMPEPRVNGGLVWDSRRELLWLVGGNTSPSGLSYEARADVWSFDPAESRWEKRQVRGTLPRARLFQTAFYDASRDALVMYGGADETAFANDARYLGDLWALDLESLEWVQLDSGAGQAPDGRFWGAMVHDTARDRYLLFGGHDDGQLGNRNDTWAFDPSERRWELLSAGDEWQRPPNGFCDFPPDFASVDPEVPERRDAHGLVWSEPCDRALVFGGKTDCGAVDDVWAFDGAEWSERLGATEGEVCLRWRDEAERCTDMCF